MGELQTEHRHKEKAENKTYISYLGIKSQIQKFWN